MTHQQDISTQEAYPIAWPPSYRLKKHRRAKHVKLRVNRVHGLEITVPYRFNIREIPSILEEKKAWILKQLCQSKTNSLTTRPSEIILQAMNEHWQVEYIKSEKRLTLIEHPFEQRIIVIGHTTDELKCIKLIITWIKKKAKSHLALALRKLSQQTNLSFTHVSVRSQKTLWGSCTSQKKINLNYRLIFLPNTLATHIMLHELCHTKYLNHSKRFWQLVANFDCDWQQHNRALRHADDHIPSWCLLV